MEKLFPVEAKGGDGDKGPTNGEIDLTEQLTQNADLIFEPNPQDIFNRVIMQSVRFSVYRALLNSLASEHASRMTAMDNASKNAGELIDKYTLRMNRARQAAITTELTEIVSGAESLKG